MENRVKEIDNKSYNQAIIDAMESFEDEINDQEGNEKYIINKDLALTILNDLLIRDCEGQIY